MVRDYWEEAVWALAAGIGTFADSYLSTHILLDSAIKGVGAAAALVIVLIRVRRKDVPASASEETKS